MMKIQYLLLIMVILSGCTFFNAHSENEKILLNSCGCNLKEENTERCAELCNAALRSGNDHGACLNLVKNCNKDSIPLIIEALKKYAPDEVDGKIGYECTVWHCLDALESLTGLQFDKEQWETWWLEEGKNWPSEKFYPRHANP